MITSAIIVMKTKLLIQVMRKFVPQNLFALSKSSILSIRIYVINVKLTKLLIPVITPAA